MRRVFLALVIVTAAITIFPSSLGILAGKEFGGRERFYVGASVALGDGAGLGVDVYYPISSFESAAEEISEAKLIEIDPGLFLALRFESLKIYAFAGPVVIFNLESYQYSTLPFDTLRGKVGFKLKMGAFSIFAEGITLFTYSPFATSGVYGVQGGVALGF